MKPKEVEIPYEWGTPEFEEWMRKRMAKKLKK